MKFPLTPNYLLCSYPSNRKSHAKKKSGFTGLTMFKPNNTLSPESPFLWMLSTLPKWFMAARVSNTGSTNHQCNSDRSSCVFSGVVLLHPHLALLHHHQVFGRSIQPSLWRAGVGKCGVHLGKNKWRSPGRNGIEFVSKMENYVQSLRWMRYILGKLKKVCELHWNMALELVTNGWSSIVLGKTPWERLWFKSEIQKTQTSPWVYSGTAAAVVWWRKVQGSS